MVEQLIIIGSGPGGLTAAIYTARAELNPLVLVGQNPGGQLGLSSEVDNYPGFPETMEGFELYQKMRAQAERFGARIVEDEATELNLGTHPFTVKTWGDTYEARALIVATGTTPRKLDVPGEERLRGRGVSYCAVCDGFFFKDRPLAVVGGGDAALEEGNYLAKVGSRVHLIHRRDRLRGEKRLQQRLFRNEKVEILWDSVVTEILGEETVTGLGLKNVRTGETSQLPVDGVFVYVGDTPNTAFLGGQLALNEHGYIVTDDEMRTSVPGVFAAGDVRGPRVRQITTAVGSGAEAAISANRYIAELEDRAYGEWDV